MYKKNQRFYEKYVKRILDFSLSFVAFVILSPIFLIISILVYINLGSPVFFKQARSGKNGKIFNMYKFRSMTSEKDENGELLPDEVRLTQFGKFLRSTSIDELPELINILKGDMSIIGPRPLLVKYLPLYSEQQARRHEARPGLTGHAQVNGRNLLTWEEKFNLDVQYIDTLSFLLDCKILLQTVKVVFKKTGVSSEDSVTMEEFKGTKDSE